MMNGKKNWLFGAVGLLALGFVGCAGEDDIDRTQPNRMPKSMFQGTWYIRSTIIGVPGTSATSFVGYTGTMEKIRWEVQEDWLIAYRAYEEIPGTDSAGKAAAKEDPSSYKENPIAGYPILGHFDIKRQYNAATGEQSNVIEENSVDRPWYERDYIRVDWSKSSISPMSLDGVTGPAAYSVNFFPQSHENNEDALRVFAKDAETNEDAKVNFDQLETVTSHDPAEWNNVNYFDMVGKFLLDTETVAYQFADGSMMDIPLCYFTMYGGRNYQTSTCGPAEVKVRTSFMKVGIRNFEPVALPDKEMAKFAYFRTERFTWDRKYGFTEAGRIYLANVFNLWEKAYQENDDGTLKVGDDGKYVKIAMKDRTPKPIVYHINAEFPCEMVASGIKIGESWNTSFRRAVAVAKGILPETKGDTIAEVASVPKDQVPDMFVVKTNGWTQKSPGDDWSCKNLEFKPDEVEFLMGDLRFNTIYWVQDRQISGPLGYGPSSPDPETGEIISGIAHVYGAAIDSYSNSSLEIIRLLNGDLDLDAMQSGSYVKDYILKNPAQIDPAKIPRELNKIKGKAIFNMILGKKKLARLEQVKTHGLQRATFGERYRRLSRIHGTKLEEYLLDDEIIKGLAPMMLQGKQIGPGDNLSKEVRRLMSPIEWGTAEGMSLDKLRVDRAARKNIWLAEFADDSIKGLAMEVWKRFGASKDYDAMWQYLRERIFIGVTEHEVGHTVGLRHNFAGSYDSINFYNKWWNLRAENLVERNPMRAEDALGFADLYTQTARTANQIANKMTESQYSSIMDYGAKFNSDFSGLGKYDHAAILFGYTGNVEVFKSVDENAKIVFRQRYSDCSPRYESTPNLAYSPILEQWHYSSVWNLLGKNAGITSRKFVPWTSVKAEQDKARAACDAYLDQGGTAFDFNQKQDGNRALEVPYMMCSDDYVGATVSCHRWDEGADPFEIANNVIKGYKSYYYFNNFKRGRFGVSSYGLYSRLSGRYFNYLPSIYQHWLFRVAFSDLQDQTLENYWTIGTWNGFNLLSQVLKTPQYGTYCKGTDVDEKNGRWGCISEAGEKVRWQRIPSESQKPGPGEATVVRGEGRRRFSRFDYESGYYYQSQITEIGSFWEQLAAIEALTTSTGIFVGVETGTDFTRFLVPYYIVFEEELHKIFEGTISEDYGAYGPIIANGKMHMAPTAVLALSNGTSLDPATGQAYTPPSGEAVNLDNWFTIKFYALLYGMSEFRSSYSLVFADRQQIFRVGSGEEVTPADGMVLLTCQDPFRGHIYGTVYDPTWDESDKGPAIKMINKCNDLVTKFKATGNPTTRYWLEDTIEWLNVLRGMYEVFGSNV